MFPARISHSKQHLTRVITNFNNIRKHANYIKANYKNIR